MITEGQYLDALKIVRSYLKQIENEFNSEDKELMAIDADYFLDTRCANAVRECWKRIYPNETMLNITLYNLTKLSKWDLMRTRHFGKKSLDQIEEFMDQYYLELKKR